MTTTPHLADNAIVLAEAVTCHAGCPQCHRPCLGAPARYASVHMCAELHQWGLHGCTLGPIGGHEHTTAALPTRKAAER